MRETVTIDRVGHRGDGIAETASGPVYVPFTLAGETVEIERDGERGQPLAIIAPSADRIEPVCRHFGECGGCALQHMGTATYRDFKRDLVVAALADRGITADVAETVAVPPAGRRRAVLAVARAGSGHVVGFQKRASHDIVALKECPVMDPAITAALPGLKGLAARLNFGKAGGRLAVIVSTSGLDVAVEGARPPRPAEVSALSRLAMELGLARLSVGGETLIEVRPPMLEIAGVPVVPPPGGFVQAARAAELALAERVVAGIGKARKVVDLFSGLGTFTLPIAATAAVHAVDGEAPALAALERALRGRTGLKKITTERRDLFRRPLQVKELEKFDAAVFDPPRAGAKEQAAELARARLAAIVAVSCNPATFARDAATLMAGGWRLDRVTPVDQFLWSPHVELVAAFSRG